jgi:hypothetical protein
MIRESIRYGERIEWQTATREEKKAFYEKMPQDLIDVIMEFKNNFDAEVITIEYTVTAER